MEEYTLIRKQRKTLTLRLDANGNVTVLAPLHLSQTKIDDFILKQVDWITRKRKELSALRALPPLNMEEGERVPLFGKEYLLKLWDKRSVTVRENEIFLPRNNSKAALIRHYSRQLKECIAPIIAKYSREMGVAPTKVSVSSARTRWGSCSGKNTLNFSFRLAMCEISVIEYVVAHELCHVLHKNHSKAFWAEVEKYYPPFKEAKRYLKQKAYFMEII